METLWQKVGHVGKREHVVDLYYSKMFKCIFCDLCLCSVFPAHQSFLKQKGCNIILKP